MFYQFFLTFLSENVFSRVSRVSKPAFFVKQRLRTRQKYAHFCIIFALKSCKNMQKNIFQPPKNWSKYTTSIVYKHVKCRTS